MADVTKNESNTTNLNGKARYEIAGINSRIYDVVSDAKKALHNIQTTENLSIISNSYSKKDVNKISAEIIEQRSHANFIGSLYYMLLPDELKQLTGRTSTPEDLQRSVINAANAYRAYPNAVKITAKEFANYGELFRLGNAIRAGKNTQDSSLFNTSVISYDIESIGRDRFKNGTKATDVLHIYDYNFTKFGFDASGNLINGAKNRTDVNASRKSLLGVIEGSEASKELREVYNLVKNNTPLKAGSQNSIVYEYGSRHGRALRALFKGAMPENIQLGAFGDFASPMLTEAFGPQDANLTDFEFFIDFMHRLGQEQYNFAEKNFGSGENFAAKIMYNHLNGFIGEKDFLMGHNIRQFDIPVTEGFFLRGGISLEDIHKNIFRPDGRYADTLVMQNQLSLKDRYSFLKSFYGDTLVNGQGIQKEESMLRVIFGTDNIGYHFAESDAVNLAKLFGIAEPELTQGDKDIYGKIAERLSSSDYVNQDNLVEFKSKVKRMAKGKNARPLVTFNEALYGNNAELNQHMIGATVDSTTGRIQFSNGYSYTPGKAEPYGYQTDFLPGIIKSGMVYEEDTTVYSKAELLKAIKAQNIAGEEGFLDYLKANKEFLVNEGTGDNIYVTKLIPFSDETGKLYGRGNNYSILVQSEYGYNKSREVVGITNSRSGKYIFGRAYDKQIEAHKKAVEEKVADNTNRKLKEGGIHTSLRGMLVRELSDELKAAGVQGIEYDDVTTTIRQMASNDKKTAKKATEKFTGWTQKLKSLSLGEAIFKGKNGDFRSAQNWLDIWTIDGSFNTGYFDNSSYFGRMINPKSLVGQFMTSIAASVSPESINSTEGKFYIKNGIEQLMTFGEYAKPETTLRNLPINLPGFNQRAGISDNVQLYFDLDNPEQFVRDIKRYSTNYKYANELSPMTANNLMIDMLTEMRDGIINSKKQVVSELKNKTRENDPLYSKFTELITNAEKGTDKGTLHPNILASQIRDLLEDVYGERKDAFVPRSTGNYLTHTAFTGDIASEEARKGLELVKKNTVEKIKASIAKQDSSAKNLFEYLTELSYGGNNLSAADGTEVNSLKTIYEKQLEAAGLKKGSKEFVRYVGFFEAQQEGIREYAANLTKVASKNGYDLKIESGRLMLGFKGEEALDITKYMPFMTVNNGVVGFHIGGSAYTVALEGSLGLNDEGKIVNKVESAFGAASRHMFYDFEESLKAARLAGTRSNTEVLKNRLSLMMKGINKELLQNAGHDMLQNSAVDSSSFYTGWRNRKNLIKVLGAVTEKDYEHIPEGEEREEFRRTLTTVRDYFIDEDKNNERKDSKYLKSNIRSGLEKLQGYGILPSEFTLFTKDYGSVDYHRNDKLKGSQESKFKSSYITLQQNLDAFYDRLRNIGGAEALTTEYNRRELEKRAKLIYGETEAKKYFEGGARVLTEVQANSSRNKFTKGIYANRWEMNSAEVIGNILGLDSAYNNDAKAKDWLKESIKDIKNEYISEEGFKQLKEMLQMRLSPHEGGGYLSGKTRDMLGNKDAYRIFDLTNKNVEPVEMKFSENGSIIYNEGYFKERLVTAQQNIIEDYSDYIGEYNDNKAKELSKVRNVITANRTNVFRNQTELDEFIINSAKEANVDISTAENKKSFISTLFTNGTLQHQVVSESISQHGAIKTFAPNLEKVEAMNGNVSMSYLERGKHIFAIRDVLRSTIFPAFMDEKDSAGKKFSFQYNLEDNVLEYDTFKALIPSIQQALDDQEISDVFWKERRAALKSAGMKLIHDYKIDLNTVEKELLLNRYAIDDAIDVLASKGGTKKHIDFVANIFKAGAKHEGSVPELPAIMQLLHENNITTTEKGREEIKALIKSAFKAADNTEITIDSNGNLILPAKDVDISIENIEKFKRTVADKLGFTDFDDQIRRLEEAIYSPISTGYLQIIGGDADRFHKIHGKMSNVRENNAKMNLLYTDEKLQQVKKNMDELSSGKFEEIFNELIDKETGKLKTEFENTPVRSEAVMQHNKMLHYMDATNFEDKVNIDEVLAGKLENDFDDVEKKVLAYHKSINGNSLTEVSKKFIRDEAAYKSLETAVALENAGEKSWSTEQINEVKSSFSFEKINLADMPTETKNMKNLRGQGTKIDNLMKNLEIDLLDESKGLTKEFYSSIAQEYGLSDAFGQGKMFLARTNMLDPKSVEKQILTNGTSLSLPEYQNKAISLFKSIQEYSQAWINAGDNPNEEALKSLGILKKRVGLRAQEYAEVSNAELKKHGQLFGRLFTSEELGAVRAKNFVEDVSILKFLDKEEQDKALLAYKDLRYEGGNGSFLAAWRATGSEGKEKLSGPSFVMASTKDLDRYGYTKEYFESMAKKGNYKAKDGKAAWQVAKENWLSEVVGHYEGKGDNKKWIGGTGVRGSIIRNPLDYLGSFRDVQIYFTDALEKDVFKTDSLTAAWIKGDSDGDSILIKAKQAYNASLDQPMDLATINILKGRAGNALDEDIISQAKFIENTHRQAMAFQSYSEIENAVTGTSMFKNKDEFRSAMQRAIDGEAITKLSNDVMKSIIDKRNEHDASNIIDGKFLSNQISMLKGDELRKNIKLYSEGTTLIRNKFDDADFLDNLISRINKMDESNAAETTALLAGKDKSLTADNIRSNFINAKRIQRDNIVEFFRDRSGDLISDIERAILNKSAEAERKLIQPIVSHISRLSQAATGESDTALFVVDTLRTNGVLMKKAGITDQGNKAMNIFREVVKESFLTPKKAEANIMSEERIKMIGKFQNDMDIIFSSTDYTKGGAVDTAANNIKAMIKESGRNIDRYDLGELFTAFGFNNVKDNKAMLDQVTDEAVDSIVALTKNVNTNMRGDTYFMAKKLLATSTVVNRAGWSGALGETEQERRAFWESYASTIKGFSEKEADTFFTIMDESVAETGRLFKTNYLEQNVTEEITEAARQKFAEYQQRSNRLRESMSRANVSSVFSKKSLMNSKAAIGLAAGVMFAGFVGGQPSSPAGTEARETARTHDEQVYNDYGGASNSRLQLIDPNLGNHNRQQSGYILNIKARQQGSSNADSRMNRIISEAMQSTYGSNNMNINTTVHHRQDQISSGDLADYLIGAL